MRSSCRESLSHPMFGVQAFVAIAGALCVSTPTLAAPRPGALLEVTVPTDRGPATVRFRFCPPGEVLYGEPRPVPKPTGNEAMDRLKRKAYVAKIKGFYILETELSQETYGQLMGEGSVDQVFQRLLEGDRSGRGEDYPIRGVSVFEAAEFCARLKKLDASNPQINGGLETRQFRLPSHYEWQYACRAIADVDAAMEKPHFNVWPRLDAIDDKAVLADCEDIWRKTGEAGVFTGSQQQVVKLLEEVQADTAIKIKIIDAFLRAGLGTERGYENTKTPPQPTRTGSPNAWNIFNMHGNVFEWAVAAVDPATLETITAKLEIGDREGLLAENPAVFFLAGGGYNHSLSRTPGDWVKFSIWGGERFDSENRKPRPYTPRELEDLNVVQDIPSGFRVVLDRILSPAWLLVIRETALPKENAALDIICQQLTEHRKTIDELAGSSQLATAQARVDFYEGLARYENGRVDAGAEIAKEPLETLAQSDPYFSYLNELLQKDSIQPH